MKLLRFVLLASFLQIPKASEIDKDCWSCVCEYLSLQDLLFIRGTNKELRSCAEFKLQRLTKQRLQKRIYQLFQHNDLCVLVKLLLIHDAYNLKTVSFNSMRWLTFHQIQRKNFAFLLQFYTDQLLQFRDPKRSHEIYRNVDVLTAIVAYYDTNLWALEALMPLTNHASIHSLLRYYGLYKEFMPLITQRLVNKLQELVHERERQIAEAMIMSRIK